MKSDGRVAVVAMTLGSLALVGCGEETSAQPHLETVPGEGALGLINEMPFIAIDSPASGARVIVGESTPVVLSGTTNVPFVSLYAGQTPLGAATVEGDGTWTYRYRPGVAGPVTLSALFFDYFAGSLVQSAVSFTVEISNVVSVGDQGDSANGISLAPSISGDGRYVAYRTKASNIVPNTPPFDPFAAQFDIIVRDRLLGKNSRVNLDPRGQRTFAAGGPVFASNALKLVFYLSGSASGLHVHDFETGETVPVSPNGFDGSGAFGLYPSMSADGRFVTYLLQRQKVVYVYDLVTGQTFSETSAGADQPVRRDPALSGDGRFLVYAETSFIDFSGEPVIDVILLDRFTRERVVVSRRRTLGTRGKSSLPQITPDGETVMFSSTSTDLVPGGQPGTFVYQRSTRQLERLNIPGQAFGISDDGTLVGYKSNAGHYVYSRATGASTLVITESEPVTGLTAPVLSGDGRSIALQGAASPTRVFAASTEDLF